MKISNIKNFDLEQTFECGQCFRWNKTDDNTYSGIVSGNLLTAKQFDDYIEINGVFNEDYFDLNRDYGKMIKGFSKDDEILKKSAEFGYGIRLLKQEPFETLVSFIISANNNIPRIKKIIEGLCELCGDKKEINGKIYYSFPKPEVIAKLTVSDLAPIKSGYRAPYIIDAGKKVASGEIDINKPFLLEEKEARKYLKQILGVGDKVADCILLFAYQKYSVFPKDVWIKRILNKLYGVEEKEFEGFIKNKFGDFGGFAQQYLFYYGRTFI